MLPANLTCRDTAAGALDVAGRDVAGAAGTTVDVDMAIDGS